MDFDSVRDGDGLGMLERHFQAMPPVAGMQLQVERFDGTSLQLRAPLAAHVNDKGCAFGGSLASLMTLACWGVVTLRLWQEGLEAEVFVADSRLRYRAPLFADLHAGARLAREDAWPAFVARLRERGRASLQLDACVYLPDGGIAAECQARYAALCKR
jgi:thioesterase domain-containing protein